MRIIKIGFPVLFAAMSFYATLAPASAQQVTPATQQAWKVAIERCVQQVKDLYPADDDSRMAERTAAYKACVTNNGTIPGTTGAGTVGSK